MGRWRNCARIDFDARKGPSTAPRWRGSRTYRLACSTVKPYSVEDVAKRVKQFILRRQLCGCVRILADEAGARFHRRWILGWIDLAEEWRIDIDAQGNCAGPSPVRPLDQCGLTWNGEPEAISRLILGFSPALPSVLEKQLGVPVAQVPQAMQIITQRLQAQVVADWNFYPRRY